MGVTSVRIFPHNFKSAAPIFDNISSPGLHLSEPAVGTDSNDRLGLAIRLDLTRSFVHSFTLHVALANEEQQEFLQIC